VLGRITFEYSISITNEYLFLIFPVQYMINYCADSVVVIEFVCKYICQKSVK